MTDLNLKKRDFEFMKVVGKETLSLGYIKQKMKLEKYEIQRIFNNLARAGMVDSKKVGRIRVIKLNKNGHYFRDWYQRNKIKIGNKNGK